MKAKLHIAEITIQNYKGFGDAVTIHLDGLGPVLVNGDNGVGKTTGFADAAIWCLFDRTISDPRPGNDVINWHRGKDTLVQIKTIDGWTIKRTRKMANHDDLLLYHLDTDITPSTNKNAQAKINELFGLDYDIFTSSILFGQSPRSPSFMKLGDQKRKAAIEKVLSLDRLSVRSVVSGEMLKSKKEQLLVLNVTADGLDREMRSINTQIMNSEEVMKEWESERSSRIKMFENRIIEINSMIDQCKLPDIELLTKKWETVNKIDKKAAEIRNRKTSHETKLKQIQLNIANMRGQLSMLVLVDIDELTAQHRAIEDYETQSNALRTLLETTKIENAHIEAELRTAKRSIGHFEHMAGTICHTCKQQVSDDHITDIISPDVSKVATLCVECDRLTGAIHNLATELNALITNKPQVPLYNIDNAIAHNAEMATMTNDIAESASMLDVIKAQLTVDEVQLAKIIEVVESGKPSMSLTQANKLIEDRHRLGDELNREIVRLDELKMEDNPYFVMIEAAEARLTELSGELATVTAKTDRLNVEIRHLEYIRKAYGDRNKIKRILLSDLVPYFNKRIKHYGDIFELPIDITFTDTLSIESSTWSYDSCSGGQQCRIDVAVMFALYDLLLSIYGPQCNIMIMDEIDKELDQKGVQAFVKSVNYFASNPGRPNTIFVISHKPEMKSEFQSEITVEVVNGFTEISA